MNARSRDERGAVLILTALLLPAVLVLGALSLGLTTLWAAHEDTQRAVDLAALAGAANVPTVNLDPDNVSFPIPVDGLPLTHRIGQPLYGSDWQNRPMAVCDDQFAGDRSIVVNAHRSAGDHQSCDPTWRYESTVLAALGACAADVLDAPGCAAALREALATHLPVLTAADPVLNVIDTKAGGLAARATNVADKVLSRAVAAALPDGCVEVQRLPLLPDVCVKTVADLVGETPLLGALLGDLELSAGGVPQVGVKLDGLLPALVTPRLEVNLTGARVQPTFSPFTFSMGASATARRTIKRAVVLPSLGIRGVSGQDAFNALAPSVQNVLNNRFDGQAAALLTGAGDDGYVIDPVDLNRTVPSFPDTVDMAVDLIDDVDTLIAGSLHDALTEAACQRAPVSRYCPEIASVVDTSELEGSFLQDVYDATYPPPPGSAPSLTETLEHHANTGEPLWFLAPLRRTRPSDFFGASAWSVLTDPSVNPVLAPLLSDLMFIPALDVLPATVGRTVISGNPVYTLRSVPLSDTSATKGLYQARLVK